MDKRNHEILIDERDMLSYLEGLVVEQDEPLADWVCIPLHFVSDLARRNGIKVVQVGEGSDEQFCGYHSYLKYLELEKRYYRPFQKLLPKSIQSFVADSALRFANWNSSFDIYADARTLKALKKKYDFCFYGGQGYTPIMKPNLIKKKQPYFNILLNILSY